MSLSLSEREKIKKLHRIKVFSTPQNISKECSFFAKKCKMAISGKMSPQIKNVPKKIIVGFREEKPHWEAFGLLPLQSLPQRRG